MRLAAHPSVEIGTYLAAPAAQPFSFVAPFYDELFDGLGGDGFGLDVAAAPARAGEDADELLRSLDSLSWCSAPAL